MRKQIEPEKKALILSMYKDKIPVVEIADTVDVCTSTVCSVVKASGVMRNSGRTKKKLDRNEEIKRKYEEGTSVDELADEYEINRRRVYEILRINMESSYDEKKFERAEKAEDKRVKRVEYQGGKRYVDIVDFIAGR